jgi:hypothetical protein
VARNNLTWIKGVVRATAVKGARLRLRPAGQAGVRTRAQGQPTWDDRTFPGVHVLLNLKES